MRTTTLALAVLLAGGCFTVERLPPWSDPPDFAGEDGAVLPDPSGGGPDEGFPVETGGPHYDPADAKEPDSQAPPEAAEEPDAPDPDAPDPGEPAPDAGELVPDPGLEPDVVEPPPVVAPQPCGEDSECASGACVETAAGKFCYLPCEDGCPQGWACAESPADGGGEMCLPALGTLCNPCWSDEDCGPAKGGPGNGPACVSFGGSGSYCGSACDAGCPAGYACEAVPNASGTIGLYCIPAGGALCECSEAAKALSLATSCFTKNVYGTCKGGRFCSPGGLTPCSAKVAGPETCGGDDEDCDGAVDEPGAAKCEPWYVDADGDGHGVTGSSKCLCAPSAPYTAKVAGDCDDGAPSISPASAEICDGLDNDCDGSTDPAGSAGCTTFLLDWDNDGFGKDGAAACLCAPEGKYDVTVGGDCDDYDSSVFPGAPCPPLLCNIFVLTGVCKPESCGVPEPPSHCPDGFVCQDGASCRTTCASAAHCRPGLHCQDGSCLASKPDGSPCSFGGECLSGHCDGGLCCAEGKCCGADAACDDGDPCTTDVCDAFQCAHEPNVAPCGAPGCDGLVFFPGATCFEGECVPWGEGEDCSGDEVCMEHTCTPSGCKASPSPASKKCGEAACAAFELLGASFCDGVGGCKAGLATPCPGSLACAPDGQKCLTACAKHGDCQPDAYCQAGTCKEKKKVGAACGSYAECMTGLCAGGICCAGCCDHGTLGTSELPRAMEICGQTSHTLEGNAQCRRVISQFGKFSHADKAPALGDTAMVQLSTGIAPLTAVQDYGEDLGTSGPDPDGTVGWVNDLCGLTVTLKAPSYAKGFAFDFIFFSAEYPEWVGTIYNDTFNVMLTSSQYKNQNVAFDKKLKPISINVAFFTICNGCAEPSSLLAGTGYDQGVGGSTGWLTTTVPIVPGETISLRFVIYDEGDHVWDSDVLLNNFRWLEFVSGTGPVTEKYK